MSGPIPAVPNDERDRKAAIEKSARGLSEALQLVPEVTSLAASMSDHDRHNGYALRLRQAYGESRG